MTGSEGGETPKGTPVPILRQKAQTERNERAHAKKRTVPVNPEWEECRFHPQLSPASLAVLERMKGREKDTIKRLTTVTVTRRTPHMPTGKNEEVGKKEGRERQRGEREDTLVTATPHAMGSREERSDHPHEDDEDEDAKKRKKESGEWNGVERESRANDGEQHSSHTQSKPRKKRVVTVEAMGAFYQREMTRLQHKAFRMEEEKRRASFQALLECTFRPQTTVFPPRAASSKRGRGRTVDAASTFLDGNVSSTGNATNSSSRRRSMRSTHDVSATVTSSGSAWTARDGPGVEQFLERQALAKKQKMEREERWRKLGAGMPLNGPHHTICTPFHLETQTRERKSNSRSCPVRSATPSPRDASPPCPILRR